MPFDSDATMRAARILTDQDPGPGDRLDAFLLLTGLEFLWRRDGPGADFAEAVCRYEAVSGRTPPETGLATVLRRRQVAGRRAPPRGRGVARGPLSRLALEPHPAPLPGGSRLARR